MGFNTRIPMINPDAATAGLQRGVEQGTGLWNQLLGRGIDLGRMHQQGQQFEKTLGFNEKQLSQQHTHHLNEMGVRYRQLEMEEEVLPHKIQAMIDAHKISPYQAMNLYNQGLSFYADAKKNMMFANLLDPNGGQPMEAPGMNAGAISPNVSMGSSMGANQFPMPNQNVQNGMSGPISQPPIPTGPQGMSAQRQNIDIPYAQGSPNPQMAANNAPLATNELIDPADLKPGQTATIRPPENPNKARLDNVAGLMGIPAVQSFSENGVQYERWPSGKITATRTGMGAEEKAELETKKKEQQETNKLNAKEYQTLKQEIPKFKETHNHVKELIKLYRKNEGHKNEWWGGLLPFIPADAQIKTREKTIKDPDFGRIKTLQAKLIGPQSQEFSTRGLKVALDLAQDVKPGFYENFENSLGKLEQIDKDMDISIKREETRMSEVSPDKSQSSEMLKGILNGEKFDVRPEDKEAFLKSGGKI